MKISAKWKMMTLKTHSIYCSLPDRSFKLDQYICKFISTHNDYCKLRITQAWKFCNEILDIPSAINYHPNYKVKKVIKEKLKTKVFRKRNKQKS